MKTIKRIWEIIPLSIQLLIKIFLSSLLIFDVFRALFLIIAHKQIGNAGCLEVFESFRNGLTYDISSSCYLLIIPFIYTIIIELFNLNSIKIKNSFKWLVTLLFSIGFIINLVDIPYYLYFNTRMTSIVFQWFSTPKIVFGFLFESYEYYIYLIPIILFCYGFYRLIKLYTKHWINKDGRKPEIKYMRLKYCLLFILFALLQFCGIRGKILTRRPLSWGEAFTTAYPVINYAGLNPIFTLGSSYFSKSKETPDKIHLMDDNVAINNTQKYLGINQTIKDFPLARIVDNGQQKNYNVVVIVMESMTAGYLGNSGLYKPTVTPFLDSLQHNSLYFTNIFSDGIHTANGVWAIFTSLNSSPSEANIMVNLNNATSYAGLGTTLYNNGYKTAFFCPHDANFDNMGGMMALNGFEKVYSQSEFLNKDFVNVWGTSDHILFKENIDRLKKLGNSGKPFLATFLTISNHGPYKLPDPVPNGFKPNNSLPELRSVEYADWSIRYLFDNIKNEAWFNNTIFVFVADHGKNLLPNYEVNYFTKHIPIIIYAPNLIKPQIVTNFGTQMDIFPTLMNILGISYINNTVGIDLLKEKRPFSYYSQHSTLGAVSDSFYLISMKDGKSKLFKYRNNFDLTDYSSQYPEIVKEMEIYSKSNIQTSMWLIKSKKGHYIPYLKK
jgi:phosphoglycerol transferase MdoB-like AlkP superfamily enzyme